MFYLSKRVVLTSTTQFDGANYNKFTYCFVWVSMSTYKYLYDHQGRF